MIYTLTRTVTHYYEIEAGDKYIAQELITAADEKGELDKYAVYSHTSKDFEILGTKPGHESHNRKNKKKDRQMGKDKY